MTADLFPWSDADQQRWQDCLPGLARIHERYVQLALAYGASRPALAKVIAAMPPGRFAATLRGHLAVLAADPREHATQEASRAVGLGHIRAGTPPSWYVAMYNQYFPAYHEIADVDPTGLPTQYMLRQRWLWDMSFALDAYDRALKGDIRELSHTAYRDLLTGLLNRRGVQEVLESATGTSGVTCGAFIVLDLDGFKAVNDACGHPAGDEVLRTFGAAFLAHVRSCDVIARIGGDEFCLWLPGLDCPEAAVERLGDVVTGLPLAQSGVGVSAGLAWYPRSGQRFADLYHAADTALYEAKQHGGGGVVVAGERAIRNWRPVPQDVTAVAG